MFVHTHTILVRLLDLLNLLLHGSKFDFLKHIVIYLSLGNELFISIDLGTKLGDLGLTPEIVRSLLGVDCFIRLLAWE